MTAVWNDYHEVKDLGASVVCLGNFDGLHRGHQSIFRKTFLHAKRRQLMSCLVTFDPHPAHVLNQERNLKLLLSGDEKRELMSAMPFDGALIQRFDRKFSEMSAESFVEDVLIRSLKAKMIMVGSNFRFGFEARGDVDLLRSYPEFEVEGADLLEVDGSVLSSSKIRSLLTQGNVRAASRLLGYHYFATGVVIHGDGRGAQIGFPTANVDVRKPLLIPFGVYGGFLERVDSGEVNVAAINFGIKPTFSSKTPSLEAHLPGFCGDLYGHRVNIYFGESVRSEMKFSSVQKLQAQIARDVNSVKDCMELSSYQSPREVLGKNVEVSL